VSLVGDGSVDRMARKLGLPGRALPPEVDLGARLVAAIREAMEAADGDLAVAGPFVQERMAAWASEAEAGALAAAVSRALADEGWPRRPRVTATGFERPTRPGRPLRSSRRCSEPDHVSAGLCQDAALRHRRCRSAQRR